MNNIIRYNKQLLVLALCLLSLLPLHAQNVEQRIDSLQLLIGQQTTLHLTVTARRGQKVVMPSYKPAQQLVAGVEVVEQGPCDTVQTGDDQMTVSRDYVLTSFDEKVYALPALNVKVDGKNYHGNPLALKVLTVPVDTVHTNKMYPPKDVQDNPFLWSEWSLLFWLSVVVLLLCVAMIYLSVRLRQNKPIITRFRIVKRIPAHEKALTEIKHIKEQHAESHETQKEYYTRLTDTLRQYIVSRFGFNAMEMTSSEIIDRLQTAGDQRMLDELRHLFQTADLVKFAKYETLINENDANLVGAIHFIDQTKTDEVQTEEKVAPELTEADRKTRSQRKLIKALLWLAGIAILALIAWIGWQSYSLLS